MRMCTVSDTHFTGKAHGPLVSILSGYPNSHYLTWIFIASGAEMLITHHRSSLHLIQ